MNESNVQTVQSIYAAFGKGDVPAILERVEANTHWSFNASRRPLPWYEPVTSKATLPKFFQTMAEQLDFHAFEPRVFVHSDDHVMVHVHIEYTVKKTSRRIALEQIHWWTLNREGKVTRLLQFEDTAALFAAYEG